MMMEMEVGARQWAIEDLSEGQIWEETQEISADLLERFIEVSQDRAPAHVDDQHAARMGYPSRLAHGFLVSLPYSRMLGMYLPGSNTVIHQLQIDMVAPVHVGDRLRYEVKVSRIIAGVRTVKLALSAKNQTGQLVNRGHATCVFRV
jgi:3-hydroxybutyryl-CoA dehydratase